MLEEEIVMFHVNFSRRLHKCKIYHFTYWIRYANFVASLSRLQKLATVESFTSENENEYEFCPREVWYIAFVHVFVLT